MKIINNFIDERWEPVKDCDGYFVSTVGRVKSVFRNSERMVRPFIERKPNRPEYCRILMDRRKTLGWARNRHLHKMVADAFLDNPYNHKCVLFKNGVTTDCRLENLSFTCDEWKELFKASAKTKEGQLIVKYLDGDKEAYNDIVTDLWKPMLDFLKKKFYGANEMLIEEAVQLSFIKAMKAN